MHASGICYNPNSVWIVDKRTLIQGALIHGMCLFEVRAATAARKGSAELDRWYKRLRRVVAKPAHKAQWHNKGTIPIYASAECCPPLCGHRGFPQGHAEGER